MLNNWDQISVGSNQVAQTIEALGNKLQRKPFSMPAANVLSSLEQRDTAYEAVFEKIAAAGRQMAPERRQYFYENVEFPLLIDWRQTTAAIKLIRALSESDAVSARKLTLSAFEDLKELETEIQRAERPPFEKWYRKTWIRNEDSPYNVHRSYERLLAFLVANYLN
jgi:sugar diacid utilization regulator